MFNLEEFQALISTFNETLMNAEVKLTSIRPAADAWSLKEIVGHLIDSASNNHQRFVRLQDGNLYDFPAYEGERWISIQKYILMDWKLLTGLWYNFNSLLLNIVEGMETSALNNYWQKGDEALTLERLVNEYYNHIKLHMDHFNKRLCEITSL